MGVTQILKCWGLKRLAVSLSAPVRLSSGSEGPVLNPVSMWREVETIQSLPFETAPFILNPIGRFIWFQVIKNFRHYSRLTQAEKGKDALSAFFLFEASNDVY